jgi:DNA-binding transcriptional ArsR family regulator
MDEIDFIENKKKLVSHIKLNPGSHLRGISRDLNMSLGTVRYHLSFLEKMGIIISRDEGNLKVFFLSDDEGYRKRNIFPLLQQKRFRDIISILLIAPGITPTDLSSRLGLNPSTLSKYLMILERREIIKSTRDGRWKHYSLVDERRVLNFLMTYKGSFLDKLVDNVLEIYFER